MADSRIKTVSELLSSFFDQDLVKKGELYSGFGNSWKLIAGSRLGEHSKPADIRHGILIVETEHQGWTQLLQLQQDRILQEVQRRFPDLKIRGIAFRLGESGMPAGASSSMPGRVSGIRSPESAPESAAEKEAEKEAEKAMDEKAGHETKLPQDMVAMFARIRKNINK
jgi:hypothetical protein